MTGLPLEQEILLRQSRVQKIQPNHQKSGSATDFDTRFADFLSVISNPELADNSQDFAQQQYQEQYQAPRQQDNASRNDEEIAIDYNHEQENTPYRADNYRDDHNDEARRDDNNSHDDNTRPEANANNRREAQPTDDADNQTDDGAVSQQQNSNAVADNNDEENNNVQTNSTPPNVVPVDPVFRLFSQLVTAPAISNDNVAITQNQANNNGQQTAANQPNNTGNNGVAQLVANPQNLTGSTPANATPTNANIAQNTEQGKVTAELQVALPNSQQGETLGATPTTVSGETLSATQNAALNAGQTATLGAGGETTVANPNLTNLANQAAASTNANQAPVTEGLQGADVKATANQSQSQAQAQSQAQTPSAILAQNNADNIANQTATTSNANGQSQAQKSVLDELPVIAKSPLQSLISEPKPQPLQTADASKQANAQQAGNANGQAQTAQNNATQGNANVSNQNNVTQQAQSGQQSLNVPVESITVAKVVGQENKQVKNIHQPLRVNGDNLLRTQENGGSQLLQDLKAQDGQAKPNALAQGAEKSVFDARNVQSQSQNIAANNVKQPQIAGNNSSNTQSQNQAEQTANSNTQNQTSNNGQQQSNQGGDGRQAQQQAQPQPQPLPQTQTAQSNAGIQQAVPTDNAGQTNATRFSQHLNDNGQAQKVHDQISVKIKQAHQASQTRINIQLRPVELGRVDVQIEALGNGKVQLTIAPEKIETLELLQRDSSTLQQTLQNAGLDVDAKDINFLLRQDFAQGQKDNNANGNNNNKANNNDEENESPSTEQELDEYVTVTDDGRINARV